ncbi:MAG TPA: hypothetical protein VG826_26550 [Pirellulales bacterium]|nr:hypothetical protein [Pirellulales bacterium]
MKWLLVICGLSAAVSLGGCCQPGGGLFSSQGAYGSYYAPANYYAAPATPTYTNPCTCQ